LGTPVSVPGLPGASVARPRLLLVEDEEAFRELLQTFLVAEGFAVQAVPDGRRGVEWLQDHNVDLIITDLCMPEADGMELLMKLRQLRCAVPIVVMSGGVRGDMAGMLRAARLLGAQQTLAKPFPLQLLVTAVRETLRSPRRIPPA
jgi:sigma-B regulation protein RsbU (phosphoserine phosphatase)